MGAATTPAAGLVTSERPSTSPPRLAHGDRLRGRSTCRRGRRRRPYHPDLGRRLEGRAEEGGVHGLGQLRVDLGERPQAGASRSVRSTKRGPSPAGRRTDERVLPGEVQVVGDEHRLHRQRSPGRRRRRRWSASPCGTRQDRRAHAVHHRPRRRCPRRGGARPSTTSTTAAVRLDGAHDPRMTLDRRRGKPASSSIPTRPTVAPSAVGRRGPARAEDDGHVVAGAPVRVAIVAASAAARSTGPPSPIIPRRRASSLAPPPASAAIVGE